MVAILLPQCRKSRPLMGVLFPKCMYAFSATSEATEFLLGVKKEKEK